MHLPPANKQKSQTTYHRPQTVKESEHQGTGPAGSHPQTAGLPALGAAGTAPEGKRADARVPHQGRERRVQENHGGPGHKAESEKGNQPAERGPQSHAEGGSGCVKRHPAGSGTWEGSEAG